jgi:glycerophosphoryl diester phosphodiesterase
MPEPRPLLLGHRGACLDAPENTFPAFDLSLAHGCDGFELDLRLSSDSVPLVCHDRDFRGLPVSATSYTCLNRIPAPAALETPHAAAAGAGAAAASVCAAPAPELDLPTLDGVLGRYSSRAYLDLELKVPGMERAMVEALLRYPPQRGYRVSSFLPGVLLRLAQLDAALPLVLVCETPEQLELWPRLPLSGLSVHLRLFSPALAGELHAAGKQVFVWTVNSASEMRACARADVDGIISDDTSLLVETLG